MAAYPCVPLSQPDAAARDHHSGRLPRTGYRRTRPRPPSPPAAPPPVPAVLAGLDRISSAARSGTRSEEHTSELQSLMRISYAVFCLKKKKNHKNEIRRITITT